MELELENRPYTLIDMETGEKVKLNPTALKEKYKEQVSEYFNAVQLKCTQYKMDYVLCDIAKGYEQVLVEYLLKRQKMSR